MDDQALFATANAYFKFIIHKSKSLQIQMHLQFC